MTIKRGGSGKVGIGKDNPTRLLEVGTSGAYCNGGAWVDGSSRKFKTGIKELDEKEAISAFNQLKPVRFRYKADPDEENLGFIAEDVPDILATKDRNGLTPMDFIAVLTKVVQKQQKKINTQQKKIDTLVEKLNTLEKKVKEIEKGETK